MAAIGVSFLPAIDMNSSVIQGCFPNGFRPPVPPRPAPMPPPVAQRATPPRGAAFPPPRPVVPQQPVVQRFGAGTAMRLPDAMATAANRSIGRPLQPAVRQMMESLFRTSFADVRVHVGPHVSAIGATSYTQGSNIHFAPGQYSPENGPGRQRLAYELAHVVQQKSGRVRNPFGAGIAVLADAPLDAEADRFSRLAAARPVSQTKHETAGIHGTGQRGVTETIQRIEPFTIFLGAAALTTVGVAAYAAWRYFRRSYADLPTGSVPPIQGQTMRIPIGTRVYHGTRNPRSEWWKTSMPGHGADEDGGVSFTLIPDASPKVKNADVIIEYRFRQETTATVCRSKGDFSALLRGNATQVCYTRAEQEIKIRFDETEHYLVYSGAYSGNPNRRHRPIGEDLV